MIKNKIIRATASEQIPQIMSEMQIAAETLQQVGWGVSIFGSARIKPDTFYYALSEKLGQRLAQAGLPVIAGGGPGIMEAANKGAYTENGTSIGLNISLPHESHSNKYQTHSLHFEYFYSRKATFFMHSAAYIALPGGFGTLDELFDVLTLVQTGKVPPAPIILMGSEFWSGLLDWAKQQLLRRGYISTDNLDLITISDDVDQVVQQIKTFYINHAEQLDQHAILPTE